MNMNTNTNSGSRFEVPGARFVFRFVFKFVFRFKFASGSELRGSDSICHEPATARAAVGT